MPDPPGQSIGSLHEKKNWRFSTNCACAILPILVFVNQDVDFMRTYLFLLVVYFLSSCGLPAQDSFTPPQTVSSQPDFLRELGRYYTEALKLDTALSFLHDSRLLAHRQGNFFAEGRAYYDLADIHANYIPNFDSALVYNQRAQMLFNQIGRQDWATRALIAEGNVHMYRGQAKKSLNRLSEAVVRLKKLELDSLLPQTYYLMGAVFVYFDSLGAHVENIQTALRLAKQYQDSVTMAESYMSLCWAYGEEQQVDSLLFAAREALHIALELRDSSLIAYAYMNLGASYWELGRISESVQAWEHMVSIKQVTAIDRMRLLFHYASFLFDQKRYRAAIDQYQQSWEIAQSLRARRMETRILRSLMRSYEALGWYQDAYQKSKLYLELDRQLQEEDLDEIQTDWTLRFETQKKEKEILALRAKSADQDLSLARSRAKAQQRFWWGLTATLSLVLLGAGFWTSRRSYRQKQLLAEQEASLQQKQLHQLRQDQRFMTLQAMIQGEEFERARLARELHDGIGILLSSLKLGIAQSKPKVNSPFHPERLIDRASSELRRITQNLMPTALQKYGLITAIEDLCDELSFSKELQITFQHFGVTSTGDDTIDLQLYRIVQELLHNVIKHAAATEVLVQFLQRDQRLFITVEDNGKGFDPIVSRKKGQGLRNLQSRVNYLNGQLTIHTQAEKGTTISIEVQLSVPHDQAINH